MIHQQIGGPNSPFRAGDAVGRWRVQTDTLAGRTVKALTCMTAGNVYVPGSYFALTTPTEAAFGAHRCWMYKPDAGAITWKIIGTDFDPTANGYALIWAADESVVLSELGVGDVVAGGTATADTHHAFDATRAFNGDFVPYVDAASFGSGNDLTTLTSVGWAWSMTAGCQLILGDAEGDHAAIKRLGVCPP